VRRSLIAIALIAVAVSTLLVGRLLAPNDFDPSTTIKFGEVHEEQNAYGARLLGEIVVAPLGGHDGRFFFIQAMDPFYFEPDVHADQLDRPTYRAQRMVYPTLASLGGLMSPASTAWGLIIVNIVAMAVGTVYTGLMAARMGLSAWFGLAFLLNPGLIVDLGIDGAGIVALAAMMAAVYYVLGDAILPAAVALSVASLARETMLIAVAGLAAFYWYKKRQITWPLMLPVVAVGAWWGYVHWRLDDGLAQDTQALDWPFVGFIDAFEGWMNTPGSSIDLAVGGVLLLVSAVVLIRTIRTPTALGWAVGGFAFLGLIMSEPVWENWFDSARALAPVLTGYIILGPAMTRIEESLDVGSEPAIGMRKARLGDSSEDSHSRVESADPGVR